MTKIQESVMADRNEEFVHAMLVMSTFGGYINAINSANSILYSVFSNLLSPDSHVLETDIVTFINGHQRSMTHWQALIANFKSQNPELFQPAQKGE